MRLGEGLLVRKQRRELAAGADAELAISPVQVCLDRLGGEEQPRRGFLVGHAGDNRQRDLELLGRELVDARILAAGAQRLAARTQLRSRSLGAGLRAQSLERRQGVPELPPRLDPPAGSPQTLAVAQPA